MLIRKERKFCKKKYFTEYFILEYTTTPPAPETIHVTETPAARYY
jgi:hypothetical protein